jgi:hypothetical protein
MRESRREAVWRGLRSLHADAPRRKEYLRERSSEPGRLCTPSGSRGAGMQRKDIFSRLTLVAGFPTCPTASFAPTQHEHKQDASGPAASAQPASHLLIAAPDGSGVFFWTWSNGWLR